MKRIDQIIVMLEQHQLKLSKAIDAIKALGPDGEIAAPKKRGRPSKGSASGR